MPEFDGAYVLAFEDGTKIIIHNPAAAGWTYQTFASYVDPRNKSTEVLRGFQSLGQETKFASIPEKGTATWKDSNLFLGKVTSADGKMSGNLSGKFFGPNTKEIGGTYGLKNTDGSVHFLGGYGAKRK